MELLRLLPEHWALAADPRPCHQALEPFTKPPLRALLKPECAHEQLDHVVEAQSLRLRCTELELVVDHSRLEQLREEEQLLLKKPRLLDLAYDAKPHESVT